MIERLEIWGQQIEDTHVIVKSNALVEACYQLSLQEQRLILIMISLIRPKDRDFHRYRFNVHEFKKITGVTGESYYRVIKDITKSLLNKSFTIKQPSGDLQIGWISSAKYYDREGYVELCFDPALKPYLLELQRKFTLYQLKNVIKMRSAYSIRIYELLKCYQFQNEIILKVEDLKIFLGIEPDKYCRYFNFKKDVIEKAKKELLEKSDLFFIYIELKRGRKIEAIKFLIHENQKNIVKKVEVENDRTNTEKVPISIIELVPECHRQFVTEIISDFLSQKDTEYVKRNVLYTNSMNYQNYPKYLASALRNDWGANYDPNFHGLLSKQGQRIHAEQKKRDEEYKRILREREELSKEEVKQKALLATLTPEQFSALTKLAIEKLHPFDQKRLGRVKDKDNFLPVVRNRLEMVEEFIKGLKS